jgi:lysozyme
MDQQAADKELKLDEGTGPMRGGNYVVYDDATGKPIVPGSVVKGHPTIGEGFALDTRGLTPGEMMFVLHDAENDFWSDIVRAFPWAAKLDPVRQVALLSMGYNLGVHGLAMFPDTLACLERGQWADAVANLKQSKWWTQVGQRAVRIGNMFTTGKYPS